MESDISKLDNKKSLSKKYLVKLNSQSIVLSVSSSMDTSNWVGILFKSLFCEYSQIDITRFLTSNHPPLEALIEVCLEPSGKCTSVYHSGQKTSCTLLSQSAKETQLLLEYSPVISCPTKTLARESETLKSIFEHSNVGLVYANKDGLILDCNPYFLDLLGYRKSEVIQMTFTDFTYPPDIEAEMVFVQELLLGQRDAYTIEKRYIHSDGTIFWIEINVTAVRNTEGEFIHFVGVARNIQERKTAEKELYQSLLLNQLVVESSSAGVWRWESDPDAGSIWLSKQCYQMLGYDPEKLSTLREDLVRLIHPHDRDKFSSLSKEQLHKGGAFECSVRLKTNAGNYKWVLITGKSQCNAKGVPYLIVGSILDIDTYILTKNQLLAQENQFNELFFQAPVAAAIFSVTGSIIMVNPSFLDMFGYSEDAFFGVDFLDIVDSNHRSQVEDNILNILDREKPTPSSFEYCFLHQEGQMLWGILKVSAVIGIEGETSVLIAQIQDITQRKLNEERLEFALEGYEDGLWDWDIEKDSFYVSPRWAGMLGYQQSELTPHISTAQKLIHPEDDTVFDVLDNVIAGEKDSWELEFRMRHKNGHWVPILCRGISVRHSNHRQAQRLVGTHLDLSTLKEKEIDLKRVHGHLEAVLTSFEDTVFLFDAQGILCKAWMNDSSEQFGLVENLVGQSITDLFPTLEYPAFETVCDLVYQSKEPVSFDYQAANQHWFSVTFRPVNGVTASVGTMVQNITESYLLQLEIEKQRELFQNLYELYVDQSLALEQQVDSLLKIGLDLFQLDLAYIGHMVDEHQYTVLYSAASEGNQVIEPGTSVNIMDTYCYEVLKRQDVFFVNEAGKTGLRELACYQAFQLEAYMGIPLYVNNDLFGVLSFSSLKPGNIQISDLHLLHFFANWINNKLTQELAQKKLVLAKEKAEKAEKTKMLFLANMSHEIRTPLNGVLGMLQLLKGTPLNNEQTDFVQVIEQSGENLLIILNDILNISKMEAGQVELNYSHVDLEKLLEKTLQLFLPLADKKALELHLDLDESLPAHIKIDPTRFEQVLSNLISNAIKFTHAGEVSVKASGQKIGQKFQLKVEIQDTGPGMCNEQQSRIFEPFYQANQSFSRDQGGTGLGLTICKQLIGLMGGELSLDSNEEGSTFTICLDVEIVEAPDAPKGMALELCMAKDVVLSLDGILVVEDNLINMKLAMTIFEKMGFQPEGAENGQVALDILKEDPERYHFILMDIQMPQLDGLEATQKIRELYGDKYVVVAMTANAMSESKDECLKAGMNDFLTKPVQIKKIQDVLRTWFPLD